LAFGFGENSRRTLSEPSYFETTEASQVDKKGGVPMIQGIIGRPVQLRCNYGAAAASYPDTAPHPCGWMRRSASLSVVNQKA